MRRLIAFLTTALLALAMLSGVAQADNHEWEHAEPHPHAMLLGVDITGQTEIEVEGVTAYEITITFDRCVDLAASDRSPKSSNGALPTPAHHHSIHTGNAGGSFFVQGPLYQAGNWVFPLAPFHGIPFESCEDIPNPFTFLSPFPLQA